MRLTLQRKIFLYTAGLVVGTIVIIFFIVDRRMETDFQRFAENDLGKTRAVFRELEQARFQRLVSLTHVIAEIPVLKAVVTTQDPATVFEAAVNHQKTAGSDIFIVTDANGRVLARTHDPNHYGDSLKRNPHVANALKGEVVVGTLLHNGELYQTVARPLTITGQLLGTIVLGFRVDDPLASELNRLTGTDVAFLLETRILASSLSESQKRELLRFLQKGVRDGDSPFQKLPWEKPQLVTFGQEPYLMSLEKVTEAGSGHPVILSIMRSLRPSLAVRREFGQNLLWMGLAFLISSMGLAYLLSRTITGSLRSLLQGTRRISAGNLNEPIQADNRDEIGELAQSFNQMMEDLRKSRAQVEDYSRHLESKVQQAMERLHQSQDIILRSEKLASIGKLASGVAHEILNPVNIIGMHAQSWLRRAEIDPKLRQSFEVIDEQVHRTARITEALRRFSRQTPPHRNHINVRDLLTSTVDLVAHEFRLNDIEVVQDVERDLPEILGDKDQLAQVLLNLLTNARDAMHKGGRLTMAARLENRDGLFSNDRTGNGNSRTVVISVEDTGEGIPEDLVSKIFDPFFTTKPVDKGTGLGLSISHSIVEAHGGEIQVHSRLNEGTRVSVHLPVGN